VPWCSFPLPAPEASCWRCWQPYHTRNERRDFVLGENDLTCSAKLSHSPLQPLCCFSCFFVASLRFLKWRSFRQSSHSPSLASASSSRSRQLYLLSISIRMLVSQLPLPIWEAPASMLALSSWLLMRTMSLAGGADGKRRCIRRAHFNIAQIYSMKIEIRHVLGLQTTQDGVGSWSLKTSILNRRRQTGWPSWTSHAESWRRTSQ